MKNILIKIGIGTLFVIKAIAWIFLNVLKLVLELLKFFLILLSLVIRIFFAFLKAGTP